MFFTCIVAVLAAKAETDSLLLVATDIEYEYPDSAITIANSRLHSGELSDRSRSSAFEIIGIARWVKEEYGEAITAHQKRWQFESPLTTQKELDIPTITSV